MHNLFVEFGLFLWAVAQQYVTLAAGCAVTVMIDLLAKHWLKRPLSHREDVAILGAFVFLACFLAWRAEYDATKPPATQSIQVNVPPQAPPQINVNVPAPTVNLPPQMAYMASVDVGVVVSNYKIGGNWAITQTVKNISTSSIAESVGNIRGIRIASATPNVYKQPIVTEATEESIYQKFQKEISGREPQRRTYGPGETQFASVFSDAIDDQLDRDFREGSKTIMFFSKQTWRDALGWHENDVCEWLQLYPQMFAGPATIAPNAQIVWHSCVKHNGLKR